MKYWRFDEKRNNMKMFSGIICGQEKVYVVRQN